MADYLTARALCDLYGYQEMASVAGPRDMDNVPAELLRATVQGDSVAQWSTEAQAAATAGVARLNSVIDEAEEQVNGTLRRVGYTVPLSAPGNLIQSITRRLARHALHKDAPGEAVRQSYEDALATLKDISKGDLELDVAIDGDLETGESIPGDADIGRESTDYDRTFTADKLANYSRR